MLILGFLRGEKKKKALFGISGFVDSWDFRGHMDAMFMLEKIIKKMVISGDSSDGPLHLMNAYKYLDTIGAARTALQSFD